VGIRADHLRLKPALAGRQQYRWLEKDTQVPKKPTITTPAGYRKEIASIMRKLSGKYDLHRVFSDWVEMFAIALSNEVDLGQYEKREARYMQIVKGYTREELNEFCRACGMLTLLLDLEPIDQLTKLFGELEFGNKHMGQFFTPWEVSYMMAKMTLAPQDGFRDLIADQGFITMAEPCCGAGGMIVAFAQACQDEGIDYHEQVHVTAVDLDARCVHMSYIQCALLGIPAVIHRGDTLRLEFTEHWYTPQHVLGGWSGKLRARHMDELDNGWWRAYAPAERVDFCLEHGIDISAALEPKVSPEIKAARELVSETA
jgi:hypothetical protein